VCNAWGSAVGQFPQRSVARMQVGSWGSQKTAVSGAGQNRTLPGTDRPAVALASRGLELPSMGDAKKTLTGTAGVKTLMKRIFAGLAVASVSFSHGPLRFTAKV